MLYIRNEMINKRQREKSNQLSELMKSLDLLHVI